MSAINLNWAPPGPVAAAYMASTADVQALMGPIGSGKTSTIIMKQVRQAAAQQPSSRDEWARYKLLVVRDTYRRLWRTTIRSWHQWLPKSLGSWTGGEDQPATHVIRFRSKTGKKIEFTAEFVAIGDQDIEDVLRGYEPTAAWLNESDRLAPEVYQYLRGRVGRFPQMLDGGPSWYGIVMDFNAPDTENWLYKMLVEDRAANIAFFVQPSGFSPQAENLANLPPGYYEKQAQGQPDWYIRRFIRNQWGYSREGMPVYPAYNDQLHCAGEDLKPVAGIPLSLGFDAGLRPAMIITQHLSNGQWLILDELAVPSEATMGPARFSDAANQLLRERYQGYVASGWADPSAAHGHDKEDADDQSWIDMVAAKTKLRIRPTLTNALHPRLEAVRLPLTRMIDGHHPGLLLSPRCKTLRKGFNSQYRYRKIKTGEGRYADQPDKNGASHPHDALQYVMLGGGEYHEVMGRAKGMRRRGPLRAIDEDDQSGSFRGGGRRTRFALSDD